MRKSLPFSLGIDLIEIKKAKGLYQAHKNCLSSFFSSKEIAYIQKSKKPHENFAVLLALKEAVFKALCCLGTGLAAFRNVETVPRKENKFSLLLHWSAGSKELSGKKDLKFLILKNKKYVVVQCAGT